MTKLSPHSFFKGTQPLTPNNSYKEKEDSVTEERIANILNEAQVAMHMKKSLEQVGPTYDIHAAHTVTHKIFSVNISNYSLQYIAFLEPYCSDSSFFKYSQGFKVFVS